MPAFHIRNRSAKGMSINIDNGSFNRAFHEIQEAVEKAMMYASGYALSAAKDHAYKHLRGFMGMHPQAREVANSLGYERTVTSKNDDVELNAIFGSKGPDGRNGDIGVGVHTDPDDNEERYNIGAALQEGRDAGPFPFKGRRSRFANTALGAQQYGRQIGSATGNTAWYGNGGKGYFYGYLAIDYLTVAEDRFEARFPTRMKYELKKRL